MTIEMKKFGSVLISRPSGKEAWLAMQPHLEKIAPDEKIILDFSGVLVLTPSWMDEFLEPLKRGFKNIVMQGDISKAVQETLEFLKTIHH